MFKLPKCPECGTKLNDSNYCCKCHTFVETDDFKEFEFSNVWCGVCGRCLWNWELDYASKCVSCERMMCQRCGGGGKICEDCEDDEIDEALEEDEDVGETEDDGLEEENSEPEESIVNDVKRLKPYFCYNCGAKIQIKEYVVNYCGNCGQKLK